MIGFGSDGANVMSGEGKGVHRRLKEQNAHMVHIHCMALCTSQAANDIPRLEEVPRMAYIFILLHESFSNEGARTA